jgi:hypothetical protein
MTTLKHHRIALVVIGVAAVLDAAAGFGYAYVMSFPATSGLCYALGVATTSDSSIPAGTSPSARLITVLIQLTIIPLFGAAFSLFTSWLGGLHVWAAERSMKIHFEERLKHHLGKGSSNE